MSHHHSFTRIAKTEASCKNTARCMAMVGANCVSGSCATAFKGSSTTSFKYQAKGVNICPPETTSNLQTLYIHVLHLQYELMKN